MNLKPEIELWSPIGYITLFKMKIGLPMHFSFWRGGREQLWSIHSFSDSLLQGKP